MSVLVSEIFPQGGRGIEKNYQPRKKYEDEVIERLRDYGAAALMGRSGYGKTSIAMHIIQQEGWNYAKVSCNTNESYHELLEELFADVIRKTSHPIWAEFWLQVRRIREAPYIGGVLERESTKRLEKKLIERAGKRGVLLMIERAERLGPEVRLSIVNLLNDLPDMFGPRPKILCLSITRICSPQESGQSDRFRNIEVFAFSEIEIAQQINSGLGHLGIEISGAAMEEAKTVSCGSPLACSQLMVEVLKNVNILSSSDNMIQHKISQSEIINSASAFARKEDLTSIWKQTLEDRSSDRYHVLEAMVDEGHEGMLFDIKSRLSSKTYGEIDAANCISELSSLSVSGSYPDLGFEADRYSFRKPFLYERLKEWMRTSKRY